MSQTKLKKQPNNTFFSRHNMTDYSTTLSYQVLGCAMNVYQHFGPGLLESVYQRALMIELDNADLMAEQEVPIKIEYLGQDLGLAFRLDILVENCMILELKSVSQLEKVHFKQLMTYLKLTNKPIGYLINFNTENFSIGHSIHKVYNYCYGKEIPAWLG